MPDEPADHEPPPSNGSAWEITKLICCGVVAISVLSCVVVAVIRSTGLTEVRVTAISEEEEPRDHNIPLFKKTDALPDYEIILILNQGGKVRLGAKPNRSAANGLTWKLSKPVSLAEISGLRLQDQDKLVSDAITEVQIESQSVTSGNYRFDFTTKRSFGIGLVSFFETPVGMAICGAFAIAVMLIICSAFLI
ncbi:hypothetical protein [Thalassoglobus polymorphus]|uniref:Uncharacterized protein n=1 Tax=Thalassoglobus polymorphus TaxID=2527994 RepID=A0A517QN44_9PLAN|nr:hypothetical protein [Thalassoglobus polymorphus]QDT33059.1 hypothetical protein Mal48_23110 [Thalassoglobus polymorphus]